MFTDSLCCLENYWPRKNILMPHFDQEINDVQAARTKLSENFVATLQQLRIGCNELVPIHRLPNQVLQEIFRQSTGCGRDHRSNIAIASTCSRWRNAALGDSMLWSCIELKLKQDVRLTTLFLERSGERPLTVHLHNFPYTHGSSCWHALEAFPHRSL